MNSEPQRVLVVDDQQLNRTLLTHMLHAEGYEVEHAENGQEALDKFARFDPDVVLLDVLMPVMDGFEAASKLNVMAGDLHIPIIFITSLDDQVSLTRCLSVGGDDFLSKPFDKVILSAKIRAHVRTREQSKKILEQNKILAYHQNLVKREHDIVDHIYSNAIKENYLASELVDFYMSPASMFNGDLLLVAKSPGGNVYAMLGDFTGHGLAAAVGALPVSRTFYSMTQKNLAVGEIAAEINSMLLSLLPDDMFCAAVILELSASGRSMSLWAGGAPDVLLLKEQGGIRTHIHSQHMALGVLDDIEFERTVQNLDVFPGESLLLFTDGVIESVNESGEMLGQERFEGMFEFEIPPISEVVKALTEFRGNEAQNDDISLVKFHCGIPSGELTSNVGVYSCFPWEIHLVLGVEEIRRDEPVAEVLNMLGQIQGLAGHQASLFMLLSEIYNNAVDHGLLELDSGIKDLPDGFFLFYERRMELLENLEQGKIELSAKYDPEKLQIRFKVRDSGKGFDVDQLTQKDLQHAHGRGINIINELCSEIDYSDAGRCIEVVYQLPKPENG